MKRTLLAALTAACLYRDVIKYCGLAVQFDY